MAANPPSSDDAVLIELAYSEATRALAEQLSLIDSFRNRAGLLLSAAAITTSVLGARALDCGSIGYAAWVALASFFVAAVVSIAILRPRRLEVAFDSAHIIENWVERNRPGSAADLRLALVLRMHETRSSNRDELSQLATLFEIASSLVVIEILAWIVAVPAIP